MRGALREQMGVKLSKLEVQCLCERLRRGNEGSPSIHSISNDDDDDGKGGMLTEGEAASRTSLPQIALRRAASLNVPARESESSENIIMGKYVKVFFVSVKNMCAKRL